MTVSQLQRFDAKWTPEPNTSCWLWHSATDEKGYGLFCLDGTRRAHRLSYEHHAGVIPVGLQLDHLCRVRCCVNPDHLEPVTPAENTRRGEAGKYLSSRTHCPKGHAYDGDNLRIRNERKHPNKTWRKCRACNRTETERA